MACTLVLLVLVAVALPIFIQELTFMTAVDQLKWRLRLLQITLVRDRQL